MKRQREPFENPKKAKKAKLGEPSVSRPHVPLISSSESPSKSLPPNSPSFHLRQLASSLPQTSPIYTHSEPSLSTTKPSKIPISNSPSPPLQKFNLTTTTFPISKAERLNELISPPSSTHSSPSYYNISFDTEPSDPQSPTIAHLQARTLFTQHQSEPETNIPSPSEQPPTPPSEPHIITPTENPITHPSQPPTEAIPIPPEPTSPTPEPEPPLPTLEEAITSFPESLVEKIRSLSVNSIISDDPSTMRIH